MARATSDSVQPEMLNRSDRQGAKFSVAAADAKLETVAIPRTFMTSTWHQNTSLWKLITETKDPFKAVLYDLMYHGPPTHKEGKLPVISVWQQRMCFSCLPTQSRVIFWHWKAPAALNAPNNELTESHPPLCRQVALSPRCSAHDCAVRQHEDGLHLAFTRCIHHILRLAHHFRQDDVPASESTHSRTWLS